MGLFGRRKLSEKAAAGEFAVMVGRGVLEHWPKIAKELRSLSSMGIECCFSEDQKSGVEFLLAVVAVQIQALPNLLPADQARRVREHVIKCVSSSALGSYPREAIEEYQLAWDELRQRGEPPFYGIASILFDKLERGSSVGIGGVTFKSPLALAALSEKVVTFGGPWWKAVTEKFRLVP